MGISTYQSYCGAQIFEAVGLQREFIAKYFTGTSSNVEGIGLFEIAEEAQRLHQAAFGHARADHPAPHFCVVRSGAIAARNPGASDGADAGDFTMT